MEKRLPVESSYERILAIVAPSSTDTIHHPVFFPLLADRCNANGGAQEDDDDDDGNLKIQQCAALSLILDLLLAIQLNPS